MNTWKSSVIVCIWIASVAGLLASGGMETFAAFEREAAPPDEPITLKLLGWDNPAAKCKFSKDNYDRITQRAGTKEEQLRPLALLAIAVELEDRASKSTLTEAEKAWVDFLANEENDRLAGVDAKLDAESKQVVDDLIAAVKDGKRPECDAQPPFVLTAAEAAEVLEKLKAKVPELAKTYEGERETSARVKILEELTKLVPAQVLERLKQRAVPPENLTEDRVKTDFALDLAVLRNKLRGHVAGDPSVRPPIVPKPLEPIEPGPSSRITAFETNLKQFVRSVLQLPANRAGLRTEADLKAFITKTIEASLRSIVPGELTAAEKAEAGRWSDTLTAENLPLLEVAPVVVQPPVVIQPPVIQPPVVIAPIPIGPVVPIGVGRGCFHGGRNGCFACSPKVDRFVLPAGGIFPIR